MKKNKITTNRNRIRNYSAIFLMMWITLPALAKNNTVHFAIQEVPPYLYKEGSSYAGPIFKLIQQLEEDLNIDGRYDYMPWARIISTGKAGQERVLVRHSMVPDREPFLHEILLGYKTRTVSYIKRIDAPDVKTFEDLKQYRVGARNLAFYSYEFNEGDLDRFLVDSDPQLFQMLKFKRLDFVVTYDVSESKRIAADNDINFDNEFTLATYQEIFLNGRYISIPYGTALDAQWFNPINCAVLGYRQSGQVDAWFEEDNVKPYLQSFTEPSSIAQSEACAGYQSENE